MATKMQADQEALMSDLQDVLADTEAMLKDVADESGNMSQAVRERISANLKSVKAKLSETEQLVTEKAKVAAKATDEYVHDNPWQSIGVAAGIGFLIGLLVSRR